MQKNFLYFQLSLYCSYEHSKREKKHPSIFFESVERFWYHESYALMSHLDGSHMRIGKPTATLAPSFISQPPPRATLTSLVEDPPFLSACFTSIVHTHTHIQTVLSLSLTYTYRQSTLSSSLSLSHKHRHTQGGAAYFFK